MSKGISSNGHRLLSQPYGVEWAGWRTDTVTLGRCGWQVAVEFDAAYYKYTLLLKHPEMRLTAFSDAEVIGRDLTYCRDSSKLVIFHIRHVAPTFEVLRVHQDFSKFREIETEPQYVTDEIRRIEDFNIFAPKALKVEEVLFDKADMSVLEHLEAIKAKQSDTQREIRDRLLSAKASAPGGKNVVVQLVNYREAA